MKYFIAKVSVMPHKEILDPQGKAVQSGLHNLGIGGVDSVRVGKHIELDIHAENQAAAEAAAQSACEKLLANPIMEYFSFVVQEYTR
jgi:phosphoribosylformylglycinamidine synthase